jgi:glutamate/tyrosine decarboxylase-like PLP-dependent enzyme
MDALELASQQAMSYLSGLGERPVGATATAADLRTLLGGSLPDRGYGELETIGLLEQASAAGGVVASSGPRYFGFVVGGSHPISIATDWLVSAWDQNSGIFELGPAVAVAEQIAAEWLVDLFGLPQGTSVGFPTGCAMAHVTALAAARHHVLAKNGWDVERDGLNGAPHVNVVVGQHRHLTIDLALRYLGFGTSGVIVVPADRQGRMRPGALRRALSKCDGPTIVCAQVGEVNTGAIDPVAQICQAAHERDAWVHVDGAFGLWAAASPALRPLVTGLEQADSWASDAHKWLNVPYDCGLVFVARSEAHSGAMLNQRAGYLPSAIADKRDPIEWVPDFSRRARSLPVWATLRTLGRSGIADQIDRCCALTRRFANRLRKEPEIEVLNKVVLNQVMVRFGDDDALTQHVISRLQTGGECWFGGTTWNNRAAMRISVTSWQTTKEDVDRSVAAILEAIKSPKWHS